MGERDDIDRRERDKPDCAPIDIAGVRRLLSRRQGALRSPRKMDTKLQ